MSNKEVVVIEAGRKQSNPGVAKVAEGSVIHCQVSPEGDVMVFLSGDRIGRVYSDDVERILADGEVIYGGELNADSVLKVVDVGAYNDPVNPRRKKKFVKAILIESGTVQKKVKKTVIKREIEINRILQEGICDEARLKENIEYLEDNKIPSALIDRVLSSYKKYDEKYLSLIKHAPTKYQGPKALRKALMHIMSGHNIRLEGEKGCGKNVLARTLSQVLNRPMIEMAASGQSEVADYIGDRIIEANEDGGFKMAFELGALTIALENDFIIEFDELNAMPADVQIAFNSIFDKRKETYVKHYGGVKGGDGFFGIITQNIGYNGVRELNEAFRDRFIQIPLEPPTTIREIISSEVPGANRQLLDVCDKLFADIQICVRNSEIDERSMSIRAFVAAAETVTEWGMEYLAEELADTLGGAAMFEDIEKIRDIVDSNI